MFYWIMQHACDSQSVIKIVFIEIIIIIRAQPELTRSPTLQTTTSLFILPICIAVLWAT